MFTVRTSGEIYSVVFIIVLLGLPLIGLADDNAQTITVVIETLIVLSLVGCFIRCSSPVLGYFKGLSFIAAHWRVGIIQLSMFVATPILLIAHILATCIAFASFALGRDWGQRTFLKMCNVMSRGKLNLKGALQALDQQKVRPGVNIQALRSQTQPSRPGAR